MTTSSLDTDGLSAAQVQERISAGQVNTQQVGSGRSLGAIFRANLFTLFNGVVGGAFLLLLILGKWQDALFGIAVIANVAIGIAQEFASKRKLDQLAILNQPLARVRRDGEVLQIAIAQVVLDDLLELRPGDQLPADATVVAGINLEIDESLLTGEAEPIAKFESDALMAGSGVIAGSGSARVSRVGAETYSSRITLEARRFSLVKSELRNALNRIIKWVTWALLPIMAIVANGQMQAVGGWAKAIDSGAWVDAAVGSIASIISMVPQGLVLITSIAFAVSAMKLAGQQVLLQELAAVEGLARVDIICFDKTGTLTHGEIKFDAATAIGATEPGAAAAEFANWQQVLAYFGDDPDANATAKCLRGQFATDGVAASATESLVAIATVPFSSKRKWSSFSFAGSNATAGSSSATEVTWVLGAPELVLLENTAEHLEALKLSEAQAALGKRTLVLAATTSATAAASASPAEETLPSHLTPVAIVTFKEQVRSDASQTLTYFKAQGVSVRIISGDNPATVAAVAAEAGLEIFGSPIDARELSEEPAALADALESNNVFGRVTPEQKRNMVAALQSRGHTVAMTGDGVNDALALKIADIGIAMGSGAAATRAVANLVLLDGQFASLPGVMGEGRRVIANIERISKLFLTKTVWAMTLAIVFGLMFWSFPFLPRQLSAVDGFIIGVPAFALALLPNNRRYLPGFLKRSLMFCVPAGLVIAAAVIALELLTQAGAQGVGTWLPAEAQTATSMIFSVTGLWVLSSLARPFDAWRISIIAAMSLAGLGFFTITPISDFFGFASLSGEQLTSTFIIAGLASLLIEAAHQIVAKLTRK